MKKLFLILLLVLFSFQFIAAESVYKNLGRSEKGYIWWYYENKTDKPMTLLFQDGTCKSLSPGEKEKDRTRWFYILQEIPGLYSSFSQTKKKVNKLEYGSYTYTFTISGNDNPTSLKIIFVMTNKTLVERVAILDEDATRERGKQVFTIEIDRAADSVYICF